MLREFYKDGGTICLGCMFYFRHMKRYDAPAIIKAYGLREDEYQFGQKACVKNKMFTWFNSICPHYVRTDVVKRMMVKQLAPDARGKM